MTDRMPGLGRDARVLLRYRWFILIVFVLSVLAAAAVGMRGSTTSHGTAGVEIWPTERQPLYGYRPLFSFGEFRTLGTSPDVAERAAASLAAEGYEVSADGLRAAVTVADTTPGELIQIAARRFDFTANAADAETASAYAQHWVDAFVVEAEEFRDARIEEQITLLQGQVDAAAVDVAERQQELVAFLRDNPDFGSLSPASLEHQYGQVSLALARLERIQADGAASPEAIRLAVADLFPSETLPEVDTATLIQGLEIRLASLEEELATFDGPGSLASEARERFLARDAAEETYRAAQVHLSAAIAMQPVPSLEFRTPDGPLVSTTHEVGLIGLVGAGAALGLAVGVIGALVLDFLDRNRLVPWGSRSESA